MILLLGNLTLTRALADGAASTDAMRRLPGRYVEVITDLPTSHVVDELPTVFDLAVEQLAEYFEVETARLEGWRITVYVMQRPERFQQLGMWSDDLPDFQFGFHRGNECWVYDQPSDYYRRHLVIHEGVHAFMYRFLGGAGPAWYREGIADMLATHEWENGELTINQIPLDKRDVPDWGRIKVIREAVDVGRGMTIEEVMELSSRRFFRVDAYAWSWALCAFLDGHPRWRSAFRNLKSLATRRAQEFNGQLLKQLRTGPPVQEAWQVYLSELDYGYRVAEDFIWYDPPPTGADGEIPVASNRGWQSTGIHMERGQIYQLRATGRYRLNDQDPPWTSEAGGITLEYYRGRPRGMLLMAIRGQVGDTATPLSDPQPLGLEQRVRPSRSGVLFVRINESAGQLSDNRGSLQLVVQPAD